MKRKTVHTATILIILIAVFAFIGLLWVFRDTPDSIGNTDPDIRTDVTTLVKDYENEESAANAKYLNKIIEISGTVSSKEMKNGKISIVLKDQNYISGIICTFGKNSIDASKVKIGSTVSIIGQCDGYLMDVILSKCVLNK